MQIGAFRVAGVRAGRDRQTALACRAPLLVKSGCEMTDMRKKTALGALRCRHERASSAIAGRAVFSTFLADRYALRSALTAVGRSYVRGLVLDVGAGTSPYVACFDGAVRSYISVDLAAVNRGLHCVGSVLALPVQGETLDTVLCTQLLEHVHDPTRALGELNRALAPGGHLVLTAPHLSRLHEEPHDYYRYTEYGLRHLIEKADLRILSIQPTGGLLSFLHTQVATLGFAVFGPIVPIRGVWLALSSLTARLCVWLDHKLRSERFFPLNYVVVARKSAGPRARDRTTAERGLR